MISRSRPLVTAWCAACQCRVRLLSPEAAASVAGISTRAMYRLIEARRIHFTETDDGQLQVCLDSLACKESSV